MVGSADIIVSGLALPILGFTGTFLVPIHFSKKNRTFDIPEGKVREIHRDGMNGTFAYKNGVPVLTIENGDNPTEAGKTYGFLVARELSKFLGPARFLNYSVGAATGAGVPRPEKVPHVIEEMKAKLQEQYPAMLEKLEGVVAGYNQWCDENGQPGKKIGLDELLLFHMIPERCHFNFDGTEKELSDTSTVGCTSIATKDAVHGTVFASNTDWESYGILGALSICVVEKSATGRSKVGFTLAGLCGILSGTNSDGVVVRMNVASHSTKEIEGIPALFFNDYLLTHCSSREEAVQIVERSEVVRLLGAYHLTVGDREGASIFHLFQSEYD